MREFFQVPGYLDDNFRKQFNNNNYNNNGI